MLKRRLARAEEALAADAAATAEDADAADGDGAAAGSGAAAGAVATAAAAAATTGTTLQRHVEELRTQRAATRASGDAARKRRSRRAAAQALETLALGRSAAMRAATSGDAADAAAARAGGGAGRGGEEPPAPLERLATRLMGSLKLPLLSVALADGARALDAPLGAIARALAHAERNSEPAPRTWDPPSLRSIVKGDGAKTDRPPLLQLTLATAVGAVGLLRDGGVLELLVHGGGVAPAGAESLLDMARGAARVFEEAMSALKGAGAGSLAAAFADAGGDGQGGDGSLDASALLKLLVNMGKKKSWEQVSEVLGPLSESGSLAAKTLASSAGGGSSNPFGVKSQVRQALGKVAALYGNNPALVLAALADGTLQARVDAAAEETGAGGLAGEARQAAARLVTALFALSATLGVVLLVNAGAGVGKVALMPYCHSHAGADLSNEPLGTLRALATANPPFLRRVEKAAFADGGAGASATRVALLRNVFARGELETLELNQTTILSVGESEGASGSAQATATNVAALRQANMRFGSSKGGGTSSADGGGYGEIQEDDGDCKGRLWDLLQQGPGMASGDWAIVLRFKERHAEDDLAFTRAFWAELKRLGVVVV